MGFVVDEGVVVGVSVAIRLTAAAALCLCRAGGGAAGMNMGQVYPIILLLDLAVTGIRCEVAFIFVRDRIRPFSRGNFYGRILCCSDWGGGGYADAAILAGQFLFDDDSGRRTAGIPIQVNIALASALFTIALPVAGNIDIAANGQSVRRRNINTARFSILRYAVIGNTAAVDANVIAGRVYSSAAFIGVVFGNAAAVHGEIRGITARAHSAAIVSLVLGDVTAVHGESRSIVHIYSATTGGVHITITLIFGNAAAIHSESCIRIQKHTRTIGCFITGNAAVVHDEFMCYIVDSIIILQLHTDTSSAICVSNFPHTVARPTVAERKLDGISSRCLNYGIIVFCTRNRFAVEAESNLYFLAVANPNLVIQCEVGTQIVSTGRKYVSNVVFICPHLIAYVQCTIFPLREFLVKGHVTVTIVIRISTGCTCTIAECMAVAGISPCFRTAACGPILFRAGQGHRAQQHTQAQGQGQE